MISIETGDILRLTWSRPGLQCAEVQIGDSKEKALNFPDITGFVSPGDRVAINTTAQNLSLGSGGYHFVFFNYAVRSKPLSPNGHIIKLRYTPLQIKVNLFEENCFPGRNSQAMKPYTGLYGTPVLIGELHSMLAPAVLTLKRMNSKRRIVYIMDDSAALPIHLSDAASKLKQDGLLYATVTCGHAFGGDYETLNMYTALMAAKEACKADIIIITPGPGVVGTGTRYGNSGIVQGEHADRVSKMRGLPFVIPRISFSDKRPRHLGISHHFITAFNEIADFRATVPIPLLSGNKLTLLLEQVKVIRYKHNIIIVPPKPHLFKELFHTHYKLSTMRRGVKDDPEFFISVIASAYLTESHLKKPNWY